ncbi:MAG: HlyD family efflux transporter periplasmic adaptor subunit [Kiritimatiellae bacterium]|nr:HlyD family efflux transporter periplasmic adaptor subunit [Kiritimatiellia bacterium]MDD5522983.1 HlyD family efflux transporter periplasmic adaptor subunit [Kiritimatiellia bacterium]
MHSDAKQYSRPKLRQWLGWPRIRDWWSFLVWLGACFAACWLYLESPQPNGAWSIRGIVDAGGVSLSPVETARIQKIHVKEGQQVRRGDLLVTMDMSLIAHGVSADLLNATSIETAFGDTHQDVLQAVSQRIDAIAALEANVATCRQEWERESGQLKALQDEQKRREALYTDRVIDDLTRIQLLPAIAALEKAVALYPQRIEMYEKQLTQAKTYYRNIMEWLGAEEGHPVSEAIRRRLNEEQVRTLINQARAEALLLKDAYKIIAPQDGTVSQIIGREGEVVAADIPILRLVSNSPDRIIAYLAEMQVAQVHVGQQLLVQSMNRRNLATVLATVESVSAEVHASSSLLTATGRQVPLRAQRIILRINDAHPFVGGEAVFLHAPLTGFMGMFDKIFRAEKKIPKVSGGQSS